MQMDQGLDAASTRLARAIKHATVTRWPGGRFIVIVTPPGVDTPIRFIGNSPDECVDMALRRFAENAE